MTDYELGESTISYVRRNKKPKKTDFLPSINFKSVSFTKSLSPNKEGERYKSFKKKLATSLLPKK